MEDKIEKRLSVDHPVDQLRFNRTWDLGILPKVDRRRSWLTKKRDLTVS